MLNSQQDIDECFNKVIYFLVDCSVRVTALLQYNINLSLATPSWIITLKSISPKPLRALSKMITPSVHQFSNNSPKWFFFSFSISLSFFCRHGS